MPDKAWKVAEREVAAIFGAKRRPLSGLTHNIHGTGGDDAEHETLYIETKYTGSSTSPYNAICKLMNQTVAKAEMAGKIPVVAIRRKDEPSAFLMVRASDLDALLQARLDAITPDYNEISLPLERSATYPPRR